VKHIGYKFNSVKIAQSARKAGVVKKSKKSSGPAAVADALSVVYKRHPQMLQTMECIMHAEEYNWMTASQQVYFFESADMARNIMRGSYQLKDTAPLYKGPESFVLMLPDDLRIAGRAGSGLLVSVIDHSKRGIEIFDKFFDALKIPRLDVQTKGEQGSYTVCVDYQENIGTMEYMRCAMPNTYIEHVMKLQTVEEYTAFMKETNCFNYFAGLSLDAAEQAYQFEMMRLVCGFLVYKHALPERVRAGLPGKVDHQEYSSIHFTKPHTATVCSPTQQPRIGVEAHYRTWHFRQLMADRFYKGEHASKAPGSRIVFVSDALVNRGDIETFTAEETAA